MLKATTYCNRDSSPARMAPRSSGRIRGGDESGRQECAIGSRPESSDGVCRDQLSLLMPLKFRFFGCDKLGSTPTGRDGDHPERVEKSGTTTRQQPGVVPWKSTGSPAQASRYLEAPMLAPAIADIDRVAGRVKSARNGAGWTKDWWPRAMRKASRRASKAAMRMGGRPWPIVRNNERYAYRHAVEHVLIDKEVKVIQAFARDAGVSHDAATPFDDAAWDCRARRYLHRLSGEVAASRLRDPPRRRQVR